MCYTMYTIKEMLMVLKTNRPWKVLLKGVQVHAFLRYSEATDWLWIQGHILRSTENSYINMNCDINYEGEEVDG